MSDTTTMIKALRVLSQDIQSGDGVANACVADAADMIESMSAELAKANEIISECWRLVGNDVDSKSTLPEYVNALNARVRELDKNSKDRFIKFAKSNKAVDGESALFIHALGVAFDKEQLRKEQESE